MTKAFLWIVDHPVITSVLLFLATGWFASQLPRLKIDASAEIHMLKNDPDQVYYAKTRERFGDDNLTVILIKAKDVFSPPVLTAIQRISAAVQMLDGVRRVDSLSTVNQIKGEGDWLEITPVLKQHIPEDAHALAQIREDALSTPFFIENLIARNAQAASINIHLSRDAVGEAFNSRFTRELDAIIARESPPGSEVLYIGPPLVKVTIVDYIVRDWLLLVPLGIVILLCILYFVFRVWHAVLIPVATSVLSIVWGLGVMAALGYAVNVVTWVIPSLLIIVGFTEDVHLIAEYNAARERGLDKVAALRAMIEAMGLPILITSITTAVGFGSLATSPIRMFVEFGHVAALAFILNFFVTIVLVPAMLRIWPVSPGAAGRPEEIRWGTHRFLAGALAHLGETVLRRRSYILIAAAAVFAVSLSGVRNVRIDAGLLSHFRQDSPLLERTRKIHEAMAGVLGFYIVVDTKERDGIKDPAVLEKLAALQRFLSSTGMVDKTLSIADYLRKVHREMNDGATGNGGLPDSRELIAQYLLLLDTPETAQFVDRHYAAANILVRHNIINAWELTRLLEQLEDYVEDHFESTTEVRYTGQDILLNNAAQKLSVTLVTGLSYTLLAVAVLNALLFRSFKVGLVSLLPNLLPVISYMGFMGYFEIPLNTGTAMIAPIAVGIAVDDTVHYMVRYRREHAALGDEGLATIATLRGEGPPIVTTSVGLAAGFLVLIFSNFLTMSHFGVLAAFVMVVALLMDLLLTPVLVSFVKL